MKEFNEVVERVAESDKLLLLDLLKLKD